jgi:hypothetical protein
MKSLFAAMTAFVQMMFSSLSASPYLTPIPFNTDLASPTASPAPIVTEAPNTPSPAPNLINDRNISFMKDVGEAYMDNFGLSEDDFKKIAGAGINVIEGNFDICADEGDVKYFLDQAQKNNLKVVMPAGSGEAEWGYECSGEPYSNSQRPVWQKEKVLAFVNKYNTHPAVFGWDSSNEAGSVMPTASYYNEKSGEVPAEFYLTGEQLKQAYVDIKSVSKKPVMIRMNGWFFYDSNDKFFASGNPFGKDMADIVMVNAYSNVSDYYADFVATVVARAKSAIGNADPGTKIIVALGAWEEESLWKMPTPAHLQNEIDATNENQDIVGIAYFKYGAKGSEWYLPESASNLWNVISSNHE